MIRFLVDECLTLELIAEAYGHGFEAHHVAHLGLAAASDRSLIPHIVDGDFTFVTNNRRDFLRLYNDLRLHAGLLIIIPSVAQQRQVELFAIALAAIDARGADLVNRLVEIDVNGQLHFSQLPVDGDDR